MTNQQNMELRSYIGSCNSEKDDLKRVIDLSVQWGLTAHEICLFLISVGVNAEVVESYALKRKTTRGTDFSNFIIKTKSGNLKPSYIDYLRYTREITFAVNEKLDFELLAMYYGKSVLLIDRRVISGTVVGLRRRSVEYIMRTRLGSIIELSALKRVTDGINTELLSKLKPEQVKFVKRLLNVDIEIHRLLYNYTKGVRVGVNGTYVDIDSSVVKYFFNERDYEYAQTIELLCENDVFYTEDELNSNKVIDYIGIDEIRQKDTVCEKFLNKMMSIYAILYKSEDLKSLCSDIIGKRINGLSESEEKILIDLSKTLELAEGVL